MSRFLLRTPPIVAGFVIALLAVLAFWPTARAQPPEVAMAVPAAIVYAQAPAAADAQPDSFVAAISAVGKAFATRDWRALAAALLVLIVMGVRWLAGVKTQGLPPKLAAFLSWLRTDRGGAVTALVVGILSAAGALLAAGGPITWSVIVSGLVNAFVAAGGYALVKKLLWPSDKPEPTLDISSIVKGPQPGKTLEKLSG